jgi:uncharacterized membrane protein YhiD involved in acid resistance
MITAAITIVALLLLRGVEKKVRILRFRTVIVSVPLSENVEDEIRSLLTENGFHIHSVDYERNKSKGEIRYHFTVSIRDKGVVKQLFTKLNSLDFINTISIRS